MLEQPTMGQAPIAAAGEMPISQVTVFGRPFHLIAGRYLPVVAGAEDGDPTPAPAAAGSSSGSAASGKADDGEDFDKDRALATIRKLRETERAAKVQLKELETLKAQDEERKKASQTEAERAAGEAKTARERAEQAEAALRTERTQNAVLIAAGKLDVVDPEAAYALLDKSAIEYSDAGKPTNVEELLKEMLKTRTYLKKPTGSGAGVPASPRGSSAAPSASEVVERERQRLLNTGMYRGGF